MSVQLLPPGQYGFPFSSWLKTRFFPPLLPLHRLAALGAVRSCPLPRLTLFGGIPSSPAIATAVADCCRHLKQLSLVYSPWHDDLAYSDSQKQADQGYSMGVVQLLTGVGPRLRALKVLNSAHHWPAEAWAALRHCTGLTSLALEAGVRDMPPAKSEMYLGEVHAQ